MYVWANSIPSGQPDSFSMKAFAILPIISFNLRHSRLQLGLEHHRRRAAQQPAPSHEAWLDSPQLVYAVLGLLLE